MDKRSFSKAVGFVVAAIAMLIATGPLLGMLGAMAGISNISAWLYSLVFSAQLLIGSSLAFRLDGDSLASLGLVPASSRIREFTFGEWPCLTHRPAPWWQLGSGVDILVPARRRE
jgi:hypothetical protein